MARLAAAHDGIVALEELAALGLTREARRRRIAQRRLIPVYRGVYAVGHGELTERGRFRAVAVPPHRRPRAKGVAIHRASLTSPVDVTHVRGIPCVSPARLLVQLATTPALEAVFERAERRRLIQPEAIEGGLHNRPGADRLRALLATHRPKSKATRSLLERMLLGELRRRGLPEPIVNGELRLDGLTLQPDLMWPAQRVLVELDGWETHGTPTARRRDAKRDRTAVLAGWIPLRFTWDDVEQDVRIVAREIETAIS